MQQLTVEAEREYVDPVWPQETADGVSVIPAPILTQPVQLFPVPRSVLQGVVVSLRKRPPIRAPRRHCDVGVESAAKIDDAPPR